MLSHSVIYKLDKVLYSVFSELQCKDFRTEAGSRWVENLAFSFQHGPACGVFRGCGLQGPAGSCVLKDPAAELRYRYNLMVVMGT